MYMSLIFTGLQFTAVNFPSRWLLLVSLAVILIFPVKTDRAVSAQKAAQVYSEQVYQHFL